MSGGATFGDILMAVVWVGIATLIVTSPDTSKALTAAGNAFSSSIKVATLATGGRSSSKTGAAGT
jgi:threonine/homoserine/homoserine lactone efflux protein